MSRANANYEDLVVQVLEHVGTRENVTSVTNCMTRLRIKVKDDQKIDVGGLKSVAGVLGVVHDRDNYVEVVVGPGKSSKCGAVCKQMGIPAADSDQGENKEQKIDAVAEASSIPDQGSDK